jgi:shikimate kinase
MLIYIIGFMGSGKSTVGKQLAKVADYKFIDLDNAIEQHENTTISSLFETKGESYFRQIEKQELYKTFDLKNTVVSCGGGTPCFFDNIDRINEHGISVYLQMPATAILLRLKQSKNPRPLLKNIADSDKTNFIQNLLELREPFYLQSKIITNAINADAKLLLQKITEMQ